MSEDLEQIEPIYGPSPFAEIYKNWPLIQCFESDLKLHLIRACLPFHLIGEPSSGNYSTAIRDHELFCQRLGIDIQSQQSDNSPTPTIEGEQNAITTLRSVQ